MSSSDCSKSTEELFDEQVKSQRDKSTREIKWNQLIELSTYCFMYEYEEMGGRLARLADDGHWDGDVGNVDSSAYRAHPSVYDSESRYCDVVAQVAVFFNEKGHTALGTKCARYANSPDLNKFRSANREEKDEEELRHNNGEESNDIVRDKGEDRGELAQSEKDTREDVDGEEKGKGEDEQAATPATSQPITQRAQARSPIAIGDDAGSWPLGGFADDDSAAAYVIDVMRFWLNWSSLSRNPQDVRRIRNPDVGASDPRPYQQVLDLTRHDLEAGHNYYFPHPECLGGMMGKVDSSPTGLSVIIRALRAVVCNYDETASVPRLQKQSDRLAAANGAMEYVRPLENRQTYHVLVEPFKPEGVRSALAALQLAARRSEIGHVLFYVEPVDVVTRNGTLSALLDVHPVIGW